MADVCSPPPATDLPDAERGSTRQRRFPLPLLAALPTLALALLVTARWGFDGLSGQDPYAYLGYAIGPLRASLVHGHGVAAFFWPLGYPFPVALLSILLGPTASAGQLASLAAALTLGPLTYLVGTEALSLAGMHRDQARRAALVGALLVAVTGEAAQAAVEVMPDGLALATALLSCWALLRGLRSWSERPVRELAATAWLALSSAALAYSIVTRWGQALLLPIWLLAALPAVRSSPGRFLRCAGPALLAGGLVLGAQLWLTLTVAPDPALGGHPFAGNFSLQGGQWSAVHLLQRRFTNADGTQHFALPNVLYYAGILFRLRYLTPFCLLPACWGLWLAARSFPRALLLLAGWPAGVLLFDAGLTWQNPRFAFMALPPVALLSGIGMAALWDTLSASRIRFSGLVVALLLLTALAGLRDTHAMVVRWDREVAVTRWAERVIPAHAALFSFDITAALQRRTPLRPLDLYLLPPHRLASRLSGCSHPCGYLLVDVSSMQSQWAARNPGRDYRYLRDGPGLKEVGRWDPFTLFRIGR